MEQLSKFTHDSFLHKFTPTFPKTIPPKQLHKTSLKIYSFTLLSFFAFLLLNQNQKPIFLALSIVIFISFFFKTYIISSSPTIYLVDYSCFKPPNFWRVPFSSFLEHSRIVHSLDQESVDFMSKVLTSSGQSQRTCIPPSLHYIPPRSTHEDAINEARLVLFPVFEDLLSKTRLSPRDIDILIVNCSGFCPSPSLSSIVVNNYSLRRT
ncbi:hypothetical protein OSB04_026213 [Centaurea solstitialis]|uniref:FAE domain-containing protein n=1 Tax=Centaurea solstitialis TaxID=347529 RepID=A0AA38VVE8_9ASTR|nr:hypothetical protein OSB04_026213 [Centaurea solstitialis]